MRVLILGASTNENRYSNIAAHRLVESGHAIELIGNKKGKVCDVEISDDIDSVKDIHTVTVYLSPENQSNYIEPILDLAPKRVIFNPGTHNNAFAEKLKAKGVEVVDACTLVMLRVGSF